VGFGKYLKTAFVNRWNLLVFLGASAAALLSGHADIALPLVMAAETGYVGLLAANPKFQKFVDAQEAKQDREQNSEQAEQSLARILRNLPQPLVERFEALRERCLELRQIALQLKNPGSTAADRPFDDLQLEGLDRLLWIHLRLLYTQFALGRFLQKTSEDQILSDIKRLENQLAQLKASGNASKDERIHKAIEDNLQTSRTRHANWQKARDNYELVKLEIDRLENKIRSLSEMAVNRHEPDFISGQVDQVAGSMLDTEKTMNDLRFVTGLDEIEEAPPELLRAKLTQAN
jgi:hypothetical protein